MSGFCDYRPRTIVQKKGQLIYFEDTVTQSWKSIVAPDSIRRHLADINGTARFDDVVDVMIGSRQLVQKMSSLLSNLFGEDNSNMIVESTSNFLASVAIESSTDVDISTMAFNIYESLDSKYGDMPANRRLELASRLFGDSVCLEVELMGWREFVSNSAAELVDSCYNNAQKSPEYLFTFKGKKFLVARCRTGKPVVLPVGSNVRNCEQAQRWISGDTVVGMPLPSINFIARH